MVNVSQLLKELILHACTFVALKKTTNRQAHLIDVIVDQLEAVPMVPLQLPNPSDPRALRIAAILLADPGDRRPLKHICKLAGASKRTVERLFQEDVGMTFGKWRQQLRLMQAMRLLAEGAKVTHAAMESGYSAPSAFIYMFRKTLGDHTHVLLQNRCKEEPHLSLRELHTGGPGGTPDDLSLGVF